MPIASVVGLFCEDIREEKTGQLTLVGVMGDNIRVPPPAERAALPKLCIYLRIHFDPLIDFGDIAIKLKIPDGSEVDFGGFDEATVEDARTKSLQRKSPIAGLILQAVMAPFQVKAYGTATLEVHVGAETYIAAILNMDQPSG